MNRKLEVHEKVDLLLESGEAELFCGIVDLFYRKVTSEGKWAPVIPGCPDPAGLTKNRAGPRISFPTIRAANAQACPAPSTTFPQYHP